jgi:hypothetical protein
MRTAFVLLCSFAFLCTTTTAGEPVQPSTPAHQPPDAGQPLFTILQQRIDADPFRAVATLIFFFAVLHTFFAPMFQRMAHHAEEQHRIRLQRKGKNDPEVVSFKAELLHFFGEVEAVFGIWVVPLLLAFTVAKGWEPAKDYMNQRVNFTEPIFVVVIMAIAASRPILGLAEHLMATLAASGRGRPAAWWLTILTVGPVLGSFITEPAAMTICALLLAEKFYEFRPSPSLAYATLGLLFVNVSVGGTLTHFAAPPVLMVAGKWGWGMREMVVQFGWKAVLGIIAANLAYFAFFRGQLSRLNKAEPPIDVEMTHWRGAPQEKVPPWITIVHLFFLLWTVANNHYPALFVGGFLFYLAFTQATQHQQFDLQLRTPLLVGFFLAGLVVHGGLQGWWIEPVLTRLSELPLFLGAVVLTAFNDNAAITYLASLVPDFGPQLKYAVVAGAVAGGGLTVIANAPNPAGQSVLSPYFRDGVSPLRLLLGALPPTAIVAACFLLFR